MRGTERVPLLSIGVWVSAVAGLITALFVPGDFLTISVGILVAGATCGVLLLFFKRLEYALFMIFVLIAWFPEFSQELWNVQSADDFASLYNYRPLSTITASGFDYIFALVVFMWFVRHVLSRPQSLFGAPLGKVMLVFIVIAVCSLGYGFVRGNETYYALREFRVSAYFALTYLMIVTTVGRRSTVEQYFKLVCVSAILVGAWGLVRFFLGMGKPFSEDVLLVYYDIADSLLIYIALFYLLGLVITRVLRGPRLVFVLLLFTPAAISFIFSYRRGAWVAVLFGLSALPFFAPNARQRTLIGAGVVCLLLATTGLVLSVVDEPHTPLVAQRLASIFDTVNDTSNLFRLMDAGNAIYAFVEHPIFGVGFGGRYSFRFYSTYVAGAWFWQNISRTCHNGYLFVLFKLGIIGFLLYVVILWRFGHLVFRASRLPTDAFGRGFIVSTGAAFAAILANNMTSPFTDSLRPALMMAFVMGFGAAFIRLARSGVCAPTQRRRLP